VSNNIGIRTESPDSLTVLDATRSGADTYIKSRNDLLGAYFQTQSGVNWSGYNMLDNLGQTATYFGYRGSTRFRVYDGLASEDRILMDAAGTSDGDVLINPSNAGLVAIGDPLSNAGLEIDNEGTIGGVDAELMIDEDDTGGHAAIYFQTPDEDWTLAVNSTNGTLWLANSALGGDVMDFWDDGTIDINYYGSAQLTHVCRDSGGTISNCSSAAEYVPTVEGDNGSPQAGNLVSIVPNFENPYGDEHATFVTTKSTEPCDNNLLGFLTDPELGADGPALNEYYMPLAIYGYFPVKVTMEGGSIKRGDGITSSSEPGVGMKATGACRVVGFALEDLSEDGEVMVFAHLTYYIPNDILGKINDLK
jgi:hypothetical protein